MEMIMSVPVIIKIVVVLIIILITKQVSKNLIIAIITGTIILAVWSGHSPLTIINISWERLSSINNLMLLLIVFQVIWLSNQMRETGVMNDLVKNVRLRVSQKTSMAVLPAIIGLLPMPGGAIFSAPMIDDCDHNKTIKNHLKTKINYWFRHVWEFWWPLYPAILLAIDITGLQIWQFILIHIPLTFFSIAGGMFFLLRHIKSGEKEKLNTNKKNILLLISPIIIVILIYTTIKIFFPQISEFSKYLPMSIGLLASILILQIQRPLALGNWKKIIFSVRALNMAIIVALIRIYGAFIEARLADGTLLMSNVREDLLNWNIPFMLIIMIIPFISGFTTGLAVGFVGASFPIVINLLGYNPPLNELLAYTVLAYGFGYVGMILSPVHICLLVTNEYFKTNLVQSIIQLTKPVSFVIVGVLLIHFLLKFLF